MKLRIGITQVASLIIVFLLCYLVGILVVFGADLSDLWTSKSPPELFSYTSTLDEYRGAISGLRYAPGAGAADPNKAPVEPEYVTLETLFRNWHPDDTSRDKWASSPAHPSHGNAHSLRRFDYDSPEDMALALKFRDLELPFVLYNIPELNDAADNVFTVPSLLQKFGSTPLIVEKSVDNHFMYYTTHTPLQSKILYSDWVAPQTELPMTFSKFLRLAVSAELEEAGEEKEEERGSKGRGKGKHKAHNSPLHYLTISAGEGGHTKWLVDALPMFTSHLKGKESSFMIVDSDGYKGINCRYGMRGVTAAVHYDGQRNFVAMIRGRKRYVLLPPQACKSLALLPKGHPSARHSFVDWSELLPSPTQDASSAVLQSQQSLRGGGAVSKQSSSEPGRIVDGPDIKQLQRDILASPATEYTLSRGEALYIPSYWFHYIISQDASVQCNARSGASNDEKAREVIKKCMNGLPPFVATKVSPPLSAAADPLVRHDKSSSFQERSRHFKALDPQWSLQD